VCGFSGRTTGWKVLGLTFLVETNRVAAAALAHFRDIDPMGFHLQPSSHQKQKVGTWKLEMYILGCANRSKRNASCFQSKGKLFESLELSLEA